MTEIFVSIFLLVGGFFSLVAGLGVLRFPDIYSRIHAATKASTFGIGFAGLAAALALNTPSAWVKTIGVVAFLFITLPVASHLLARAVLAATSDAGGEGLEEDEDEQEEDEAPAPTEGAERA